MQQSKSLLTENSSTTDNPTVNVDKLLSHWTWELYSYTFATLFGVLALSCFVAFVRQCTQPSLSRNIYGRFTTVQLFLAATLQVVSKLWNPILLQDASMATFIASLILKSFTMALILSAFSILLLLMLETTKTSLGAPRLQNIWVLLGITAAFTAIMLTFNLLGLYGNREIWFFVSHLALFIWGILICVGYSVAGYRMWRNLKSSRQERHSAGEGRLKHIIGQLFTSAFVTALSMILDISLVASEYGIYVDRDITEETIWSRYAIIFLKTGCRFAVMVLIFAIVVRTKSRSSSVDDGPAVRLGTFTADTTREYKEVPKG